VPEWVRWQYTETEWQGWITWDWQRAWAPIRRVIMLCTRGLVLVAVCTALLFATGHTPFQTLDSTVDPWYIMLIGIIASFGLVWSPIFIIAGVLTQLGAYQQARQWRAVRQQGPHEIIIGPTTVWQAGQEIRLLTHRWELGAVWLERATPEQTVLALRLVHPRQHTVLYDLWLPVPAGHEAEAEELVQQLRSRILGIAEPAPATGHATVQLPPLAHVLREQETQRLGEY
jgi:hypothetical protein